MSLTVTKRWKNANFLHFSVHSSLIQPPFQWMVENSSPYFEVTLSSSVSPQSSQVYNLVTFQPKTPVIIFLSSFLPWIGCTLNLWGLPLSAMRKLRILFSAQFLYGICCYCTSPSRVFSGPRWCVSSFSCCRSHLAAWCSQPAKMSLFPPVQSQQSTCQTSEVDFPPLDDTLTLSLLLPSPHRGLGISDFLHATGRLLEARELGLPPPNGGRP